MRSFVCAQCHVDYYFAGDKKRLTFPWHKGIEVNHALDYFNEIEFNDWTHAETGAPILKAQHPEFEIWSQGVHSKAGVSCSDCHMPYKRVGATKISDHHIRSPLLNINNACQTCHKRPESEILAEVESIQKRNHDLTGKALDALVELIDNVKAAKQKGYTDEQFEDVQQLQRKASFFVDWVEAENSSGFHAPQQAARILGEAIDASRQPQIQLRDSVLVNPPADEAPADEAS
jgi:nitrite reductase (cytochrome c-552)